MVNEAYATALRSMWEGKATITCMLNQVDSFTGRTTQTESIICEEQPCRISFKTVEITAGEKYAAKKVQKITLFIDKEVKILPGSQITVTQGGETQKYISSGQPAVYSYHQEVPLTIKEDWA